MRIAAAVGLCGLSLLLGTGAAGAMTPVSPEQILCSGDHIFVGRVTAVANRDCRLGPNPLGCRQDRTNDVELTIHVNRVIGARTTAQGELRVGQTLAARSFTYSSPHNTKKFTGQGSLAFRGPPEALLPEGWLQAAYVDQGFSLFRQCHPRDGVAGRWSGMGRRLDDPSGSATAATAPCRYRRGWSDRMDGSFSSI